MKVTQPSQPDLEIGGPAKLKGQHGGRRAGAGKPKGSRNALPLGSIAAIKAMRHRVPEGASPEVAELAGRSFERIVDVMEGNVHPSLAFSVLTASRAVREETCGPIAQKVEASGPNGGALEVVIRDLAKEEP